MEQCGRVPHEDPEIAAAAAPGRLEPAVPGLPRRDARGGEHLAGHRDGEAERDHGLHEPAAAQPASAYVLDQIAERSFIHGERPISPRVGRESRCGWMLGNMARKGDRLPALGA